MNAALCKVLCLGTESFLKETTMLISLSLKACRRNPVCSVGSTLLNCQRHYKSCPTHGIGRFQHLLPPKDPKKGRRAQVQMKEIDPGTNHVYGTLNIVVTGYDMTLVEHYAQYIHKFCNRMSIRVEEWHIHQKPPPVLQPFKEEFSAKRPDELKTVLPHLTKINGLSAAFAPVFLEIVQSNQPEGVHLLVKEYAEEDFGIRLKTRPELEELRAQAKMA